MSCPTNQSKAIQIKGEKKPFKAKGYNNNNEVSSYHRVGSDGKITQMMRTTTTRSRVSSMSMNNDNTSSSQSITQIIVYQI
jgi:hypothetical protein